MLGVPKILIQRNLFDESFDKCALVAEFSFKFLKGTPLLFIKNFLRIFIFGLLSFWLLSLRMWYLCCWVISLPDCG